MVPMPLKTTSRYHRDFSGVMRDVCTRDPAGSCMRLLAKSLLPIVVSVFLLSSSLRDQSRIFLNCSLHVLLTLNPALSSATSQRYKDTPQASSDHTGHKIQKRETPEEKESFDPLHFFLQKVLLPSSLPLLFLAFTLCVSRTLLDNLYKDSSLLKTKW